MMLADYRRAIGVARRQAGKSVVGAAFELACARIVHGIGPRYYSLMSLWRSSPATWSEYVLDAESSPLIRAINSPAGRMLATDKLSFGERMAELGVPSIPILGLIAGDGTPRQPGPGVRYLDRHDFVNSVAATNDRLFFKQRDGAHGAGAFSARRVGNAWQFAGRQGSAEDVFDYCVRAAVPRSAWIVQPALQAHAEVAAAISPNALGTVRVVTVLQDHRADVLVAVMRMPVGASPIDNFSEGATGGVVAPVDVPSGILGPGVTSRSTSWPEMVGIERHPDTGCLIEGFQLPHWSAVLEVVTAAQVGMPEAPTLGWDVGITDAGPVLVEANTGYDSNILQVAHRRGLRSLLARVHAMPPWQASA